MTDPRTLVESAWEPLWTHEELLAIKALQRVARKWPQSLKLFSAAGSLIVIHTEDQMPFSLERTWGILGIPNDGGDPDWEAS